MREKIRRKRRKVIRSESEGARNGLVSFIHCNWKPDANKIMEKIFKAYIIGNAKKKKLKETKEIFKQEKYNLKKNSKHVTVKIEQKVRKIFIARNGRKETTKAR